jgi:hypothetical protein
MRDTWRSLAFGHTTHGYGEPLLPEGILLLLGADLVTKVFYNLDMFLVGESSCPIKEEKSGPLALYSPGSIFLFEGLMYKPGVSHAISVVMVRGQT